MDLLDVDTEVELVQLIAPDGTAVPGTDDERARLAEELPRLYELMLTTRELDEEFVHLQRQGQLALFPSSRGQEAAQVGSAAAMRDSDWIFPQYRELGSFLVRGVEPGGIGQAWRGSVHGGVGLVERRVAPICISIGTNALHAVGSAMASTWSGDDGVTLVYVGDGGTSQGDVHEAMNLASVQAAPCVFFVQNNGWAISTPVHEQLRAPSIAHRAIGYGMPGVRVDGNDVAACRLVVEQAAARARAGDGPILIEAVTYRMGPHTTSDDPTRYRSQDEVAYWATRDPLDRCATYLRAHGLWDDDREQAARSRAATLRTELRDAIYDAPDGPIEVLFDNVFVEPTPELLRQRAELLDALHGDDDGDGGDDVDEGDEGDDR